MGTYHGSGAGRTLEKFSKKYLFLNRNFCTVVGNGEVAEVMRVADTADLLRVADAADLPREKGGKCVVVAPGRFPKHKVGVL